MIEDKKPVSWLLKLVEQDNIADDLDESLLGTIGAEVVRFCEQDENSRQEWMDLSKNALKLANQTKELKNSPWPGCSNIKYPVITEAAIQVNSRIYPEVIKGNQVVKTKVVGVDHDGKKRERGYRIARHMNWQLTEEMPEWEADFDRLTIVLPVVGLCFKKTYYSPLKGRNVSELCLPDKVVVHYRTKDLVTTPRITHLLDIYPNGIYERQASGIWLEVDLPRSGNPAYGEDPDAPHEFLEQHCYLDLDGDGYKEPYIVTVHKDTSKVMRIVARFEADKVKQKDGKVVRIEPTHYFTAFPFIPNPDGSFYSLGFGQLLEPINESINTALNQMIDAGTKQNLGGGFLGRGARIKGGRLEFTMGEYKMVDCTGQALRDNLVDAPAPGPSPVLFQLLGFLVEASKSITIPDVLSGDAASMGKDASPNTVMAMIDQGMKVFGVIYKRIYRSLGEEFKKLYRLNSIHLKPETWFTVQGMQAPQPPQPPPPELAQAPPQMQQQIQMKMQAMVQQYVAQTQQMQVTLEDYKEPDIDVIPVADPSLASDLQRAAKAQVLMGLIGAPGIQGVEVVRMVVHDLHLDEEQKILLPNDPQGNPPKPTPPPQMIIAQAKAQDMDARIRMDMTKFELEIEELKAKIGQTKANTLLALAKAGKESDKNALEQYKSELAALSKDTDQKVGLVKEMIKLHGQSNGGGVRGVEGTPGDQKGGQADEGSSAGATGVNGPGANPV